MRQEPCTLVEVLLGEMGRLFRLAYLITGTRELAAQAFEQTSDCEEPVPACGKFIVNWARKLLIDASLRLIGPELSKSTTLFESSPCGHERLVDIPRPIAGHILSRQVLQDSLLAVPAFPRCVLVLTVFEDLSLEHASSLLDTSFDCAQEAQIVGLLELTCNLIQRADCFVEPAPHTLEEVC